MIYYLLFCPPQTTCILEKCLTSFKQFFYYKTKNNIEFGLKLIIKATRNCSLSQAKVRLDVIIIMHKH